MNAALDLATDLEKIAAREWLREQGLSEAISALDFAIYCLRDEGLEVDEKLADAVLWNCTGFPSFWQVGVDGAHPIECCSTQLRRWARVALLSREKAALMMNDPVYSAEQAFAELEAEGIAITTRLLEND